MTTDTKKALSDSARYELAGRFFISEEFPEYDFLSYVRIVEPPQPLAGNLGGTIPLERWPCTIEMAKAFTENRQICLIKARQIGFSWLSAAYVLWMAYFHEGAVVLIFSKGEEEAYLYLDKVKQIHDNLPPNWKLKPDHDSRSEMTFPSMKSRIRALPSTENAGISETSSLVIQDEADYHPNLAANVSNYKPTTDAGGQVIMASSPNERQLGGLFKSIIRSSTLLKEDSEWHGMFFDLTARPGRDQQWYDRTERSIPEDDLLDISREQYMHKRYPRTLDEALSSSRTLSHFNIDWLKAMEKETKEPKFKFDYLTKRGKTVYWNMYVARETGHKYVAASDTSRGVGKDYHVTVVLDLDTLDVVADIVENEMDADELAELSVEMLNQYHQPIWAIEINDSEVVKNKATEMGYKRLYHRKMNRLKGGQRSTMREAGWWTETNNRSTMWGDLKQVVDSGRFTVYSKIGMNQFFSIINDKRIEAASGAHDDYPTACAIAYQMRHEVAKGTGKLIKEPAAF